MEDEEVEVSISTSSSAQNTKPSDYSKQNKDEFQPIDYTRSGIYHVCDLDEFASLYRWRVCLNDKKNPPLKIMNKWKLDKSNSTPTHHTRINSPIFDHRGSKYSLAYFPEGLPSKKFRAEDELYTAIYLKCEPTEDEQSKKGWARYTHFQITLLHPTYPKKLSIQRDSRRRFNLNCQDWGFRHFCNHKHLKNNGFQIQYEDLSPSNISRKFPNFSIYHPLSQTQSQTTQLSEESEESEEEYLYFQLILFERHEKHKLHPLRYNSRGETGYIGIKNQGCTCYLNSLLQTLFLLRKFRSDVYSINCEISNNTENIQSLPYALQSLFFSLEHSPVSVSTTDLTKSFGWGSADAFLQHDVQELTDILFDRLEQSNKKITDPFKGLYKDYLRVPEVDYLSGREIPFSVICLNVKNQRDIYSSFESYICEDVISDYSVDEEYMEKMISEKIEEAWNKEMYRRNVVTSHTEFLNLMDSINNNNNNNNQDADPKKLQILKNISCIVRGSYKGEEIIPKNNNNNNNDKMEDEESNNNNNNKESKKRYKYKYDARKGIVFIEFPDILILLLKRFDFNFATGTQEKLNSHFIFHKSIDLSPYTQKSKENKNFEKDDFLFELFSVTVHQGDISSGHYWCYVSPLLRGSWLRFDDERVYSVFEKNVVEDNFGNKPSINKKNKNNNNNNNNNNNEKKEDKMVDEEEEEEVDNDDLLLNLPYGSNFAYTKMFRIPVKRSKKAKKQTIQNLKNNNSKKREEEELELSNYYSYQKKYISDREQRRYSVPLHPKNNIPQFPTFTEHKNNNNNNNNNSEEKSDENDDDENIIRGFWKDSTSLRRRGANAYMLVYVKKSKIKNILYDDPNPNIQNIPNKNKKKNNKMKDEEEEVEGELEEEELEESERETETNYLDVSEPCLHLSNPPAYLQYTYPTNTYNFDWSKINMNISNTNKEDKNHKRKGEKT